MKEKVNGSWDAKGTITVTEKEVDGVTYSFILPDEDVLNLLGYESAEQYMLSKIEEQKK
jgi:hypothetical protein